MSVVQYANLCDKRILLTADAGRGALTEAADYAPSVGLELPGINTFQVPHHGSRRNVSTEILDCLLGERLSEKPEELPNEFKAIISASKDDEDHPRKAVIRAAFTEEGQCFPIKEAVYVQGTMYPNEKDGQLPRPYHIQKNKRKTRLRAKSIELRYMTRLEAKVSNSSLPQSACRCMPHRKLPRNSKASPNTKPFRQDSDIPHGDPK